MIFTPQVFQEASMCAGAEADRTGLIACPSWHRKWHLVNCC